MLRVLNQYNHGYVFAPVAAALERGGAFALLGKGPVTPERLAAETGANPGPLHVALEMLLVLGWAKRGETGYELTGAAKERVRFDRDWTGLYAHSPLELVSTPEGGAVLAQALNLVAQGWGCEPPLSLLLDGPAMLSLLIGTAQAGLAEALALGDEAAMPPVKAVWRVLEAKKWGKPDENGLALGGVGKFMFGRAMVGGVTASYRPLLLRMPELLFGDADAAMRGAAGSDEGSGREEGHVDRTLNVQSSGFQHEKYFADMDQAVREVCAQDRDARPGFVADMGCGDGSLLRRIHKTMSEALADSGQEPAIMVGLDLNQAALEETARTLNDIPHHLLPGDVGAPERIAQDFAHQTGQDPGGILHVRSFLDHNRIFAPPRDQAAAGERIGLPTTGAGIGPGGTLLSPAALQQNLVEHLRAWATVLGDHGLLCLEVHAMSQWAKSTLFDLAEGFHFDALHALSRQYLCEPHVFLAALAEAGLFPDKGFSAYPKGLPYTRITLGMYRPRPYAIRPCRPDDIPALAALAGEDGFDSQAARTLLEAGPNHCFVVQDMEGMVQGGLFCRPGPLADEIRPLSLGPTAVAAPEWTAVLIRHMVLYYGVQDGQTVLAGPVPEALAPALDQAMEATLRFQQEATP